MPSCHGSSLVVQDSGGGDDCGGEDGGGGSIGSGGAVSVDSVNEVPVELSPPQPVEPNTAISARNTQRHRDVNSLVKQPLFPLFKIRLLPVGLNSKNYSIREVYQA
jgi:hypothetical protein